MAITLVQRGNESRMVRSLPQLEAILEDRCQLDARIQKGLDVVTAAEMSEYLKAKLKEIEALV